MRYLFGFVCVCALGALPLVGCSDSTGDGGAGGMAGMGGTGGTAGTGGTGGLCTNAEDTAVFDMLEYTNDNGAMSMGVPAAANIAGDCLFGEPPRCGAELADVIVDNNAENSAALADCVVSCTSMQAGLTTDCLGCYGDIVTCGAVECVRECAGGAFRPDCQICRIDNNCDSDFAECTGFEPAVPGMLSVTVTEALSLGVSGPPLEGVELCETDTTNCATTDADGLASIMLPTDQEVSYTLSKEGYVPYLFTDVTDALFSNSTTWAMTSDQLAEDFSMTGMFPYPWTGGAIILSAIPSMAGVTYDLVGETPMAFYFDEDRSANFDLTATTSDGVGGFVEAPTGEYQVEFGGTATNCTPQIAWPGDAPNRIRVPVRVGYSTYGSMWCDAL